MDKEVKFIDNQTLIPHFFVDKRYISPELAPKVTLFCGSELHKTRVADNGRDRSCQR